jgi:glycyl-tRNA synthetase beta chain
MPDFLLEIGTEEIPAGYIPRACSALEAALKDFLENISYKDIKSFATPRRLAILISDMAGSQQDCEILRTGPPRQAAYDEQGNPTQAALGFAKGQGVSVDDLTVEKTPKGEYIAVVKKEVGESTPRLLAEKLPDIIRSLPFPKSMRWGDKTLRFARPIHWIVALYGDDVVPFELDGIQSSNVSRGHRFLPLNKKLFAKSNFQDNELVSRLLDEKIIRDSENNPDCVYFDDSIMDEDQLRKRLERIEDINIELILAISRQPSEPFQICTVTYPNHPLGERKESYYVHHLRKNNVFPDPYIRKETIREQLDGVLSDHPNWSVKDDEDLLDEVTYLVEYSKVVLGTFEEKFLALPDEVLITAMREHQKYFSVIDGDGKLVNRFLVVSNMNIEDTTLIRAGNERVLRARLTDAEFFFQSDTKCDFAALTDKLEDIVFQEKLGTVRDKVERIRKICVWLTPQLGYDAQVAKDADRAAQLCKNDLVTEMVYEFPKLQGIMGREYAIKSGENKEVAQAIYEHYLTQLQDGKPLKNGASVVLGIADRIDTICGCFGVDLIPTGSTDPYALRRQANGILSALKNLEKDLDKQGKSLNHEQLVEITLASLGELIKKPKETKSAVLDFFKARMLTFFTVVSRYGKHYDSREAVLAYHDHDFLDAGKRIIALEKMRQEDYSEPLITSFKRVSRIIPDEAWDYKFSPDKLVEPAESALWEAFNQIKEKADASLQAKEYNDAMETIAGLRGDIDRFFDEVLVMDEDEDIRRNRLALLVCLDWFFRKIADFSKIVVESEKK